MTGRRSWNEYILRNGEYIVLVDDALRQKDLSDRLSLVSYENYKQQKQHWNNRLKESVLRRRFRKKIHWLTYKNLKINTVCWLFRCKKKEDRLFRSYRHTKKNAAALAALI